MKLFKIDIAPRLLTCFDAIKGPLLAVAAFSFASNLLFFALPIYLMQVYGRVITSHSTATLLLLTIITIFAFVVTAVLDDIRSRILVRIGSTVDRVLAANLFSAMVAARRPTGEELFVEKFVIEPARRSPRAIGVMGSYDVFGNVLVLTPKARADAIFLQVGAERNRDQGWVAAISRLPNEAGLVYKVLGSETLPVRACIREFWKVVRREVAGREVPEEFAWRQ